jgi:hypothetical protein
MRFNHQGVLTKYFIEFTRYKVQGTRKKHSFDGQIQAINSSHLAT